MVGVSRLIYLCIEAVVVKIFSNAERGILGQVSGERPALLYVLATECTPLHLLHFVLQLRVQDF